MIVIGNITITVVDIGRGNVKIGITAPADVNIARKELLDADGKPKSKIKKGSE